MCKKIRNYVPIILISALLVICLFLFQRTKTKVFVIQVDTNGDKQIIECWHEEDSDLYYYFLPAHYKESNSYIKLLNTVPVYLDDTRISEGMSIDLIELNKEYSYRFGNVFLGKVVFLCGNNVPSMFVSTDSGSTKSLDKDKNYKEGARMSLVDIDGDVLFSDKMKSISERGNGSWTFNKKSYTLSLNEEEALLGLRDSKKYVLISNHYDDTCGLRNMFAYNMAKSIDMEYTCDIRFVNLYVNNVYSGLYSLVEKIDYNKDILDIGDLEKENSKVNKNILIKNAEKQTKFSNGEVDYRYSMINSPDDISGGYIIERNYAEKLLDKDAVFSTNNFERFVVRFPSIISKEECEYIRDKMQSIENALFSNDYVDSNTGKRFEELVDLDSFVLKYLVDETTKNEGAGSTSSYFYKKKNDEIIYAGPIWDYDKSLGNCRDWISPQGLSLSKMHTISPTYWYERMYYNENFFDLLRKYYKLSIKSYCKQAIDYYLDNWKKQISDSYNMNYIRWMNDDTGHVSGDIESATEYVKSWLQERLEFLDSVWYEND